MSNRRGACIAILGLFLVPHLPAARSVYAGCGEKAAIETVEYRGHDTYRITVTSSKSGPVQDFEDSFLVQTDKGWTSPSTAADGGADQTGSSTRRTVFITIPLNIPYLFRTNEGDISLMHRYTVQCRNRSGGEIRDQEEVLYWITPHTSKWILREGM